MDYSKRNLYLKKTNSEFINKRDLRIKAEFHEKYDEEKLTDLLHKIL